MSKGSRNRWCGVTNGGLECRERELLVRTAGVVRRARDFEDYGPDRKQNKTKL